MWTVLCLVVAAFFGLFALVQLNDPDPWIWLFAYGITALLSATAGFRRLHPSTYLGWALACALGAMYVWIGWEGASEILGANIEEAFDDEVVRELAGLALCIAWMAIAAAQSGASRLRTGYDQLPTSHHETAGFASPPSEDL